MRKSNSGISASQRWLPTRFDVTSMPDYAGLRRRFLKGFEDFVSAKKWEAVQRLLPEELRNASIATCPAFVQAVIRHLDNEALLEKHRVFLPMTPQMLV